MAARKKTATSRNDPVTAYAKAVTSDKVVAGPHVRDACKRHLRDLVEGPARGLTWDLAAANRAINFFKDVLCLAGGEFEGLPYILLPWQAFIVGSLFGWKTADGYRRFRVAYVESGKGSGKSPLAAGIGIYGMVADGEPRAEIYAAATKKDQAMVLFRDAVAMVDQSPALRKRVSKSGVGTNVWNLGYPQSMGFFRPIASDEGKSGPRPHIGLLDEIHEHRNGDVVEFLRAGTKGRRQALIFMITNSGVGQKSYCRERHDYGARVCAGTTEDDSFFAYICALDKGEDPFKDKKCWPKANPSLGITIQPKYLEEQIREAQGMPSKEATVRRLNFCQWVEAHDPWIGSDVWFACEEPFELDDMLGRRCWGGLDLSSTTDLTSLVLLFEPTEDDPFWRLKPFFWLPADGLMEKADKDQVPYPAWRDAGHLETTEGRVINKLAVARRLAEIGSRFDLQEVGYDRWRIEDFKSLLDQEGIEVPLVAFGQGFKDMSPALDEFERVLIGKALRHDGNPVMTMCAANAVVVKDPAGNRKVSKEKATGRVDGTVAAIMAAGRALAGGESEGESFWAKGKGAVIEAPPVVRINSQMRMALEYVNNTNGGATRAIFIEDCEPIGARLWGDLSNAGYVREDENGRIRLTETGMEALRDVEEVPA